MSKATIVLVLFTSIILFACCSQQTTFNNRDNGLSNAQLKKLDEYPIENLDYKDFFTYKGDLIYYYQPNKSNGKAKIY